MVGVAGQNEFESRKQAKTIKQNELGLASKSTGSLGKFDKKLKGEQKAKVCAALPLPLLLPFPLLLPCALHSRPLVYCTPTWVCL